VGKNEPQKKKNIQRRTVRYCFKVLGVLLRAGGFFIVAWTPFVEV
jgi:hypothetical protein